MPDRRTSGRCFMLRFRFTEAITRRARRQDSLYFCLAAVPARRSASSMGLLLYPPQTPIVDVLVHHWLPIRLENFATPRLPVNQQMLAALPPRQYARPCLIGASQTKDIA